MATVLLTGATGFLGLPCLERLLRAGHEVHAVCRHPVRLPAARWHSIDLLSPGPVSQLLADVRPTHLLHLAWIATPGVYWTSPENLHWVDASLHLVREFSRHGGRRAVLAGTCAEYDWDYPVCQEETTPLRPTTRYGQCKLHFWQQVQARNAEARLALAWARIFFLYGPREHPARLVPSVICSLLGGEEALCTAGTQRRDFLHVADAADALVRLLDVELEGAVNIASGRAVAVADVVRLIGEALGAPERIRLGARPSPPNDPPELLADVGRLSRALGWAPRWGLREGIAATIDWWKRRGPCRSRASVS